MVAVGDNIGRLGVKVSVQSALNALRVPEGP